MERLTLRGTDPITGDHHHLLYHPPRTQQVRDRLLVNPVDAENSVRRQLSRYHAYKDDLLEYYCDAVHVNGDQDAHTVFETIESVIVNPLPNCKSTMS